MKRKQGLTDDYLQKIQAALVASPFVSTLS
jgi:hypothetical protein